MKILPFLTVGLSLAAAATVTAQTSTYFGNGNTGFGGTLGNGVLTITSTATNINFSFSPSGNLDNNVAIYVDSVAGGFNSTTGFTDNADGGRTALSGFSTSGRTVATFNSGFNADYGISLEGGFAGLFTLVNNGSFAFVNSGNLVNTGGVYSFSFLKSDLGLPASGGSFAFEASLISSTGYRSNETIGTSVTIPGTAGDTPNAGFTGATTFTSASTYTVAVPEPGSVALLGLGGAALAGLGWQRTRRQA